MNTRPNRSKESRTASTVITCRLSPIELQHFKALKLAHGNINTNALIKTLITNSYKQLKDNGYI